MDLQSSQEMGLISGSAFDAHFFLVLILMVGAGVLGGAANAILSERQSGKPQDWRFHMIFGVITALTAPLLLSVLSSRLLEFSRVSVADFFVLAAFCLLYVIVVRRIFDNPARIAREEQERLDTEITELRQNIASLQSAGYTNARDVMTYHDFDILRAMADESYVYGNLPALAEKTGLGRELINQRLSVLKNMGLIDTRIGDRNILHWVISSLGQQILSEAILEQNGNN